MRTSSRRLLLALTTVAVVVALGGGCRSDNDEDALSKDEYIEQADAICADMNDAVDAAFEEHFGGSDNPSEEQIEAFVAEIGPVVHRRIDEVRALPAPEGDEDLLEQLFGNFDDAVSRIEENPVPAFRGQTDIFGDFNARAREYGVEQCTTEPA